MYHAHPLYRVGELRDGIQRHIREIKEILGLIFEVSLEHDLSNPAGKRTLPVKGSKCEIRNWKKHSTFCSICQIWQDGGKGCMKWVLTVRAVKPNWDAYLKEPFSWVLSAIYIGAGRRPLKTENCHRNSWRDAECRLRVKETQSA